jgi:enterochelin esterase-like enzyme
MTRAVAGGESSAAFWDDVERSGTPFVEEIAGESDAVCVTFVHRADPSSPFWTLCEGIAPAAGPGYALRNIPGSDICLRLPRTARVTYGFSPHRVGPAALAAGDDELTGYFGALRSDPYNPKTFSYPVHPDWPGPFGRIVSVLELPGAPTQRWVVPPGRPSGTTSVHAFPSALLRRSVPVYAYRAAGAERAEATPLLVLFDGFLQVEAAAIPSVLDNLVAAGEIPPVVALMPESGPQRFQDLVYSDDYCSFVADELVAWARDEWGAGADAATSVVGGGSAGGLCALYTALRHPDVFGNVISQVGAVGLARDGEKDWLLRRYAESPRLPLRIWLEAGLLDNDELPALGVPAIRDSNRRLRDVLVDRGYDVTYSEFAGGHDHLCIRETQAHALIELLGRREERDE